MFSKKIEDLLQEYTTSINIATKGPSSISNPSAIPTGFKGSIAPSRVIPVKVKKRKLSRSKPRI